MVADFRPPKRIRDQEALIRKVQRDRHCRMCGKEASEGHHVLLRSQGGDDVEENIVPLCLHCHRAYHDGKGRIALKTEERAYLDEKLGVQRSDMYRRRRRLDVASDS